MKDKLRSEKIDFLKPKHEESIRIEGKLSYHEGLQGWGKLLLSKDILKLCKELQDKQQSGFMYMIEYPLSKEARKKYIEELMKNPDSWPFFLRFKKREQK